MKIIIRHFDPISDSSLIYSSAYKQVKYANFHPHSDDEDFFAQFQQYVGELLTNAKIWIACTDNDHNTIIGYSIINKNILEFVYVKELHRKQGIATILTKNKGITGFNKDNLTTIGQAILDDHPNLFKQSKEETSNEIPEPLTPTIN
jgi:Acetyltransferase (GNAT) family